MIHVRGAKGRKDRYTILSDVAIAISSKWIIENGQDIVHTQKDNIEIVDCTKLAELAEAINSLIRKL